MKTIGKEYKGKRYYIRVIRDDGDSSILSDKDKTEFCLKTATKHANYMWEHHGKIAYIIEA